jgi:biotin carboxylase
MSITRIEKLLDVSARVNELNGLKELLIVIGGGMLQYATFVETANMGIATLLVDGEENCYCRAFANQFLKASTREPYMVLEAVKSFLSDHPDYKIIGVYTQGCDVEFTVATVAEYLNLPTIGAKVARSCNNKIETRMIFASNYIPQPTFYGTDDLESAKLLAQAIGFPCVCKAIDNCASRGITIVRTPEQVEQAFNEALRYSTEQRVLIEEFIEGNEYSVDTIIYKNKLYPCGISDREFMVKDNYAVQTGSLTPSQLPTEKQAEIYELMEKAAKALKVDNSAFKGDIIISKNKVLVLEVTARLSGGFDSQYRKPLSFGINLIKATIDLSLGRELNFLDIIPKWFKFSKTFHIFPEPGVIKSIEGLDELGHIDGVRGVHKIFWGKNIGDRVRDYRTCADRVVHITGHANTLEEMRYIEERVRRTLKVNTE